MNKLNPFFSVVIPLYNKAHFIEASVKSVLQQDFENFELIIVDDGSTDDSLAKVNQIKDPRIQLIQQKNKGAAAARNYGVEFAKSNWIAFLDADDVWKKNHLSELHKALQQFPEEVVFTTRLSIVQENKKEILAIYNFPIGKKIKLLPYFENSVKSDLLNTSGILIQKVFFKKLGGFNETIYSGQDTDLFIRIGLQKKVVFNPKSTFVYQEYSENNISKTPRFKERLAFINDFQNEAESNSALQKYLDLNRFSIYLRAKIQGDSTWKLAVKKINKHNLSKKQIFLMKLPSSMLKLLKNIQLILKRLGIKRSAF